MSGYSDGRRLEYAARDVLAADGYEVFRSAGSKGTADLIAIKPGDIVLVQCKKSKPIGPAERDALRSLATKIHAVPLEARWVKDGREARRVGFWHVLADDGAGRPVRASWSASYAIGAEI